MRSKNSPGVSRHADEVVEQPHLDAAPGRADSASANCRPMASSLKMYISSEMRERAASIASSQAGKVSVPFRSSLTACPPTSSCGSSM